MRLVRLFAASRRMPAAVLTLAGCGVALSLVLRWTAGVTPALALVLVGAAAAVVGAAMQSPFDESERATGPRLPLLRLAGALGLTAAAYAALAAGATAGHLTSGAGGLLRDTVGLVGVALFAGGLAGANRSWTGVLAYVFLALAAADNGWTTPWLWPARPPSDTAAALCATAVFLVGAGVATVGTVHPRWMKPVVLRAAPRLGG
ncbi:hypothetical protein [Actinoplanes subtropicus]|uniref:hypothetical protein n=1 Tax=Actinoplanes subtropicus TaxID=543632 RepID=UPI0004C3BE66|nr:hypothetical protein [Actinoplanes subtropicus]